EKGKEYRAQREAILGIPTEEGTSFTPNLRYDENVAEAKKKIEAMNDSDSGTGQDDKPAGSADTSKPKQPSKPKKKRKAGKRAK
ncbi:unnamed protein product, partial [marine sediment metagenome]